MVQICGGFRTKAKNVSGALTNRDKGKHKVD
ncbi:hypothetical protein V6Z11_D12G083000 [Gossypium hirsutum]